MLKIHQSTKSQYRNDAPVNAESKHEGKKKKDKQAKSGQGKLVTQGYKTFVVNEENAEYNYIRGYFTKEDAEEAFSILDINQKDAITAEDLSFYLEYIRVPATPEEIQEMIKMCDKNGNGEVTLEEFTKLVLG